jgi:hypothetical protein
LRDEVNRSKGEQGKPKIKENQRKGPTSDHVSEQERHKRKQHNKSSKKAEIHIDREEVVDVDREKLPTDTQPKGREDVVLQDLLVHTDNVCFHKQKYYSALAQKTYLSELPKGYEGEYGPGLKTLIMTMYFRMGTSDPKIGEFLENMEVQILEGKCPICCSKTRMAFTQRVMRCMRRGCAAVPTSKQMIQKTGWMGRTNTVTWCATRSTLPTILVPGKTA